MILVTPAPCPACGSTALEPLIDFGKVVPTSVAVPLGAVRGVALEISETTKYTSLSPQTVDSVILDLISSR